MTMFEEPPSPPASESTRNRIAADLECAIFRVRRFFDSLHRGDGSALVEDTSPVPPERRSLALRRYLHRHRLQHSRSSPARQGSLATAAKPADSPWPSPARGRRQPQPQAALRDVHSTPEVRTAHRPIG
ncbi:hypothetical protein FJT64_013615 [Amphibalanus amphitrite]|nr:hypothetical protein FJT64_013615 [Amphibalanus amphitrite]